MTSTNNTLFQYSTVDALMKGIYDGTLTFEELCKKGDFGLGTVNALDGEMVALDGVFYQITSDGKVHILAPNTKTPFAVVTFFNPEKSLQLATNDSYQSLKEHLDEHLGSPNYFSAIRLEGSFSQMKVRSVTRQEPPYSSLVVAAETQSIFKFNNITGTLVGFRFPPYFGGINVPSYHFHFLSSDKTKGGHLLECTLTSGTASWGNLDHFSLQLPQEKAFAEADLSEHDAAALQQAEE